MANEEVEERPVEKSELSSGVKLKAGHAVHLLVGGLKGAGSGEGTGHGGAAGTSAGSGQATGEGGGSSEGDATTEGSDDHAPSGGLSAPPKPPGGSVTTVTTPPADSGGGEGPTKPGGTGGKDDDSPPEPGGGTAEAPPPETTKSKKVVFEAAHFETDKAFPLPESLQSFRDLAKLANAEPKRPLLVLGHTDAAGTTEHNLGLSGDRAAAVAAYLKNDVDAWMVCFDGEPHSKKWGTREVQRMLHALPWGGDTYLKRAPSDTATADVRGAMARFQRDHELPDTATKDDTGGLFDKATRKKLVEAYMAADGTTAPAPTKIATLACGPRHLKVQTKGASAPNRRVEVLAFESDPFTPSAADYEAAQDKNDTYQEWLKVSQDLPKGSGGKGK